MKIKVSRNRTINNGMFISFYNNNNFDEKINWCGMIPNRMTKNG